MPDNKRPRAEIFFEREVLASDAPTTKKMLMGPYNRTHEMEIKILHEAQVKHITDNRGLIEQSDDNGRRTLDYFVDGSIAFKPPGARRVFSRDEARLGGYSVVSQVNSDHQYGQIWQAFLVEKAYTVMQVEKMGATESLAIVLKTVKDSDGKLDGSRIRVFIDSQPCLHQWDIGISPVEYTGRYARDITRPIDEAAIELWEALKRHRCEVILYWIPRNSTMEHKRADKLSFSVWDGEYRGKPVKKATRQEQTVGLDDKVEEAVKRFFDNDALVQGLQAMNI